MSGIEIINPGTPVAGPYNPGIKVAALTNIKKIVEAAGGKISNVVNTTVFLKNMQEFKEMNSAYKSFFNDNGVSEFYPARATVEVSNLPLASMLIEISAIVSL
jgi:2-iminobutanoate/2-iminopropanoate deaminase